MAIVAAGLALAAPEMLVNLLLIGYSGIAQLAGWQPPLGLHPGFVGLVLNFAVPFTVSAVTKPPEPARVQRFETLLAE